MNTSMGQQIPLSPPFSKGETTPGKTSIDTHGSTWPFDRLQAPRELEGLTTLSPSKGHSLDGERSDERPFLNSLK